MVLHAAVEEVCRYSGLVAVAPEEAAVPGSSEIFEEELSLFSSSPILCSLPSEQESGHDYHHAIVFTSSAFDEGSLLAYTTLARVSQKLNSRHAAVLFVCFTYSVMHSLNPA